MLLFNTGRLWNNLYFNYSCIRKYYVNRDVGTFIPDQKNRAFQTKLRKQSTVLLIYLLLMCWSNRTMMFWMTMDIIEKILEQIYVVDNMCEKRACYSNIQKYSESCSHPRGLSSLTLADPLHNSINTTLNFTYISSFEKAAKQNRHVCIHVVNSNSGLP